MRLSCEEIPCKIINISLNLDSLRSLCFSFLLATTLCSVSFRFDHINSINSLSVSIIVNCINCNNCNNCIHNSIRNNAQHNQQIRFTRSVNTYETNESEWKQKPQMRTIALSYQKWFKISAVVICSNEGQTCVKRNDRLSVEFILNFAIYCMTFTLTIIVRKDVLVITNYYIYCIR